MQDSTQIARAPAVFIVDDDAMVRRALARFLRAAGLEVETFGSARAFLARDPQARSGFLLLDVSMPDMSGPELHARLRECGSQLAVHFMSALDDARLRERELAAGARAWFQKPIDGAFLLDAIARVPRVRASAE
jgi:FixJ family two-component response regulator